MSVHVEGGKEMRRAIAIVALPSLVVALFYMYVLRPRAGARIEQVRESIDQSRRDQPPPGLEGESQRQIERLRTSIAELEGKLPAGASMISVAAMDPTRRAAAAERLAMLLVENRLELIEELATSDTESGMPDILRKRLTNESERTNARTLRFRGRWFDVLALLEAMRAEELMLVPLQLKLAREKSEGGAPAWTLVVI